MQKDAGHSEAKGRPTLLKPSSRVTRPRAEQPQLVKRCIHVHQEEMKGTFGKRP